MTLSDLASMSFNFLIYKIGIIIIVASKALLRIQ